MENALVEIGKSRPWQAPIGASAAGRRATQGSLQQLNGTVRQVKGSHGFLRFMERDGAERSVFFHSSEVKDGAALKPGDEVSFNLQDNTRTKELNARRIQRTKVRGSILGSGLFFSELSCAVLRLSHCSGFTVVYVNIF